MQDNAMIDSEPVDKDKSKKVFDDESKKSKVNRFVLQKSK